MMLLLGPPPCRQPPRRRWRRLELRLTPCCLLFPGFPEDGHQEEGGTAEAAEGEIWNQHRPAQVETAQTTLPLPPSLSVSPHTCFSPPVQIKFCLLLDFHCGVGLIPVYWFWVCKDSTFF